MESEGEREWKRETMNTPRKYLFEEKFSHKRFFNRKISLEIIVKKRGNIQQNKTKEIDVFLWINLETQRNRVDQEKKTLFTLH